MAKLKVIAACGSGMGSSQIIKMKLEKAFKKLGLDAEIYHTNVGSASLVGTFTGVKATVIGLKNLLSEKEMTDKIQSEIIDKK